MCIFSVVIPCYNGKETIARALDSVFKQTFQDFEIIVINSNSNDGTTELLYDYYEKCPDKQKLIICNLDEKHGPGFNRNYGWNIAKGRYVAFLDADDYWLSNKLEDQFLLIKNTSALLIGNSTTSDLTFIKDNSKSKKVVEVSLLSELFKNRFLTSTVVVDAQIKLRFDESSFQGEDYLLWCQIIAEGNLAIRSSKILVYYNPPTLNDNKHLSSNLLGGQRGERMMLKTLRKNKKINIFTFTFFFIFYKIKYLRRKIIFKIRSK